MFDRTVTIINQKNGVWFPHVLHNAQISTDRGYIVRQYGADCSDGISVFLHYEATDDGLMIEGYKYCAPIEYASDADPTKSITFRGGTNFDIIYVGEYVNTENDSDYAKGFYEYMRKHYDGVYAISNVAGAFMNIPHFEITGR